MFKKIFSPSPQKLLLNEIRNRLQPLGFKESTVRALGIEHSFKSGDLLVVWVEDIRDRDFWFHIYQGVQRNRPLVSFRHPFDQAIDGFKEKVLKALDDWLKTI